MARVRVEVPVSPVVAPTQAQSVDAVPAPVTVAADPQGYGVGRFSAWSPQTIKRIAVGGAAFLLLIFMVSVINDRNHLKREVGKLSNPQASAADEAQQLAAQISQFVELPSNETPTVATVLDASKVKDQPFFQNAQNNDKVLLYAKAGKAVLYRPSTKKVVEVAPINLNTQTQSAPATTGATPTTTKK